MATTINADTTNGAVITSDTSGEIKLQSAGADIVSVTANGMAVDTDTLYVDATNNRVGIGTNSPSVRLELNSDDFQQMIMRRGTSGVGAPIISFLQGDGTAVGHVGGAGTAGGLQFRTGTGFGTERMRIDSSGKVYIGCTSAPSASVHGIQFCPVLTSDFSKSSANSTGGIRHIGFYNLNGLVGGIETSGSATSFATSSDYRLKENVAPMSNSVDRLKQLKPSTWSWKVDGSRGEGFLAHEAQTVVPEAVSGTKDAMRTEEYEVTPAVLDNDGNVVTEAVMGTREVPNYQGIDQSKLVPLLTAALQEAITKIEDLEIRIQTLESV